MVSDRRSHWIGLPIALMGIVFIPVLVGSGCPGGIQSIQPGVEPLDSPASGTGNAAPTLSFTRPTADFSFEVGDVVSIKWDDDDPDNDARITLVLDPDGIFDNGVSCCC